MAVVSADPADPGNDSPSGQLDVRHPLHPQASPSNDPSDELPERFQILALDGGGAKALFTAHVLARLEEDLGVNITDSFDLIAGTSAGGIVALGLGAGLKPREIAESYEQLVGAVFPATRRRLWRRPRQLTAPVYEAKVLRQALTEVLGDRRLGESTKRLIIPAWDVQRGAVHIFKTPHHPRLRRDNRLSMVDVAMATSAAPTFFAAAHVDGQRLIDGGVWANNPSVVAISEAVSMLDVPLSSIRVLNVGAVDQRTNHPERLGTGGWLNWAKPAVDLMVSASSRGAQGTAMHLIGAGSFVRFDAVMPGRLFTLDRADPGALAGLAAGESRALSPHFTERFADHHVRPYTQTSPPRSDQPVEPGTSTTPGGPS
ncbi:CBASS cGAMP-activated phospholipase [Rhodococcus sp. 1168]|uniref:CBASS cGAMP-activated phospholipase n=1 Tax=Rhodococcus sp. 1168 TaxID=2018041 RepID=UPI000B5AF282|nr:CBASS cGAMP-activated phospholipase [Rhodococcus sp. 1168]